ncbi:elongation factor-like GTPase 1 isoform X2 [Xenia sp. Carnegie-2017]|nr:elongation factor-like GTPase 1 isoform X2 [Xenia sp. Carnegie-2017]
MEKTSSTKTTANDCSSQQESGELVFDWSSGLEDVDDSMLYFSPEQGNVVFSSAVDGWGFRVDDFAELYAIKMGVRSDVLMKTLWGDFYLQTKTKRIMKGAQAKAKKPLFVQFILNYIWEIYEAVCVRRDKERIEKIVNSLKLRISARDSRQSDPKTHLKAIFHQWLPLSKTLLQMVVNKLPSPLKINTERVEKLMCGGLRTFESLPDETKLLKQAFVRCSSEDGDPVIIFVSKMVAVDEKALPQNKRRPLTQKELEQRREKARQKHSQMLSSKENEEPRFNNPSTNTEAVAQCSRKGLCDDNADTSDVAIGDTSNERPADITDIETRNDEADQFIAFARVYSGTITKGQILFVLGPKHDPAFLDGIRSGEGNNDVISNVATADMLMSSRIDDKHCTSFTVKNLYLLMGRELESLKSVPAGNILGIGGLGDIILKSATISSTVACPPFTALPYDIKPIVRVAVEPLHPGNMSALHRGMGLLNQADPIVEVLVQETGEHVLIGTGEVHIHRCIDDLKQRFANIELKVSDPIIPFRETIVPPPTVDMVNEVIQNESSVQMGKTFKENKEALVEATVVDDRDVTADCEVTADTKSGVFRAQTGNKRCVINIRACPLPHDVTQLLDANAGLLKDLQSLMKTGTGKIKESVLEKLKEFYKKLERAFEKAGNEWKSAMERIWAFGPRHVGPNILMNNIPDYQRHSIWKDIVKQDGSPGSCYREYDNSVINGFQLATSAGPLCEEPLMGVCFVIENMTVDYSMGFEVKDEREQIIKDVDCSMGSVEDIMLQSQKTNEVIEIDQTQSSPRLSLDVIPQHTNKDLISEEDDLIKSIEFDKLANTSGGNSLQSRRTLQGILSGQIISAVKDGCRQAFQLQPARLMAAMYTCSIQTPADVLGRMYGVISKREGRVLSEEMKEGSDIFIVEAVLPVAESFGFTEEIRKKTSGLARPLLHFTHWEVIDLDPYWVPTTEEEYVHFGEKADSENQARKYMNHVRRRKGLYVEAKTVEHAEKQRTLKK